MRFVISLTRLAVYFSRFVGVSILNLMMTTVKLRQWKEKPQRGLGGFVLGLLTFETKTHPVTVDITIGRRIGFLQLPKSGGTHIVAR
jgi:hypothetical protein